MLCFVHFDLQMYLSLQRRAIFRHRNFKKWSAPDSFLAFWLENVLLATAACNFSTSQLQKVVRPWHVLYILTWKCASRYSGVQFFLCPLQSYLRTRRFSEVTFRPSRHTKHWKTQHFATSLTFRACGSSFFPHLLIFFLAALLFQLSILSEVRLLNFLRWYFHWKKNRCSYRCLYPESLESPGPDRGVFWLFVILKSESFQVHFVDIQHIGKCWRCRNLSWFFYDI